MEQWRNQSVGYVEKYVQRDLEDQIEEEYKQKGLTYNKTKMTKEIQVIKPEDVLELIQKGYTRFKKEDEGYGNIEEKYNLSPSEVRRLFKHPLLSNKKRKVPGFVFADEVEATPAQEKVEEITVEVSTTDTVIPPVTTDEKLFN